MRAGAQEFSRASSRTCSGAVEHAVFPPALENLLTADLETGSLHNALRRLGLHPTLGSSVLTARTAGEDAPELDVSAATPMLVETRSVTDQHGAPLEHTVSSYVAHRYALQVDFSVVARHENP
ncbi:UTRA domain-containing protein [Streptomyces sp. NPDC050388]|uniref:UTRA domain-containing protein n=1 Tax=Streptomyces sp. NPDC050388 TaxID=3155781 RepID=UPI003418AFBD